MDQEDQLIAAAAALGEVEAMHASLMSAVSALKEPKIDGAEFRVTDSELVCTCLGIPLRAPHRPFARDGMFRGVEYTFVTGHGGEWLPVWSMYLLPGDSLYSDSMGENVICSVSNPYLPSRIAPHIASVLLESKIFAPRA